MKIFSLHTNRCESSQCQKKLIAKSHSTTTFINSALTSVQPDRLVPSPSPINHTHFPSGGLYLMDSKVFVRSTVHFHSQLSSTWFNSQFKLKSEIILLPDSFSVNAVGNLSILKPIEYRDASRILVAVRVDNQLSRLSPFSTIVEIIINDINDRPLFNYLSPLVIGYPERTFIDPAVFMPLFVFQVNPVEWYFFVFYEFTLLQYTNLIWIIFGWLIRPWIMTLVITQLSLTAWRRLFRNCPSIPKLEPSI